MPTLPRNVWLLGWVSLATDAASEAIYPLLPFFLTSVLGAGPVSLGVVEGAAEATNSVLKIASGRMADRLRAKRPLVLLGYAVSSFVRPLIAAATGWAQVLTIRVIDRAGKGVRGAPRDAMLAAFATPATRGRVFGFQRGMDHLGAVIGPVLATLFLSLYPGQYRTLFALALVPGMVAVLLVLLVREGKQSAVDGPSAGAGGVAARESAPEGTRLSRDFRSFMLVLTLFTLGNSTDAFLLLRLTEAAGSVGFVPLAWAGLHVVKASVSIVGGTLSDRIGRQKVIAIGWIVYAVVYAGFAASTGLTALLVWFFAYGLYFGFSEGAERALVADLAPVSRRGAAFGIYNAVTGIGALVASVVFGFVWTAFGAPVAFGVGALLALLASALLFIVVPERG
jgi:MFS family permease